MNNGIIIKICQVIDVNDINDGERIKVRIEPDDDFKRDEEVPYAFPLLPKMIHVKPKLGEYVLIILTEIDNGESNRYYIGPIISQPQYMYKDNSMFTALSLYNGALKEPDIAPSTVVDSHGALAENKDIAIYGRDRSDVILTDNDVRIRCGSRLNDSSVKGGIVFNRTDPSFIHLKHTDNKRGTSDDQYRSTATLVADKINLISNKSKDGFRVTDSEYLISDDEMQKIISKAHKLPYGDVLIDFLKIFVRAFVNHVHPYPGLEPCYTVDVQQVDSYELEDILSDNIKIS